MKRIWDRQRRFGRANWPASIRIEVGGGSALSKWGGDRLAHLTIDGQMAAGGQCGAGESSFR